VFLVPYVRIDSVAVNSKRETILFTGFPRVVARALSTAVRKSFLKFSNRK
jgi:hypothetical protein